MSDSQSAVLEFLNRAIAEPGATVAPDMVHTHISCIVRSESTVYKLKRAVRFPYLDFSTPQKRYDACCKEFELNRRTAPGLYRDVLRVTRSVDGGLEFDGTGELVDAVLQMVRFDDALLLSKMAERHELYPLLLTQVACAVAKSHRQAPVCATAKGANRLQAVLELNRQSEPETMQVLGTDSPRRLNEALMAELRRHAGLLDARAAAGKVRHCHGDLHLGNLCVHHGMPVLFDCLEFNDDMATVDVLYDLAFLLMDLWRLDEPALANWVMNRYLDEADETDGLGLLPLFMALRASIRAQVLATQAAQALTGGNADEARVCIAQANGFIAHAFDFLHPRHVGLLAVGGLSGSGKSTVAKAVAYKLGPVPGARVLSTDRLRKQLFSVPAETRLLPAAYVPEVSARVYANQVDQARLLLSRGVAVVADAVFSHPEGREAIENCALECGVPFAGVWLDVAPERLLRRVADRRNDPSDATPEVVERQLENDIGAMHWSRIPNEGSIADVSCAVWQCVAGRFT